MLRDVGTLSSRIVMAAQRIPSVVIPRFLLEEHRPQLDSAVDARAELIAGDDPRLLEEIPDSLEVIEIERICVIETVDVQRPAVMDFSA